MAHPLEVENIYLNLSTADDSVRSSCFRKRRHTSQPGQRNPFLLDMRQRTRGRCSQAQRLWNLQGPFRSLPGLRNSVCQNSVWWDHRSLVNSGGGKRLLFYIEAGSRWAFFLWFEDRCHAALSPHPLPYIKWFHCRCSCSRQRKIRLLEKQSRECSY